MTSNELPESTYLPQNVFTWPTERDITLALSWTTMCQTDDFLLQKSHAPEVPILKSLFNTVASVFDTKQPAYRILFQRDTNTSCLEIAVAETEEAIDNAWRWIGRNMVPELDTIDDPRDKQEWVNNKIMTIIQKTNSSSDELLSDEKYREASRAFRQIFDVPPTERLVNYYSCACNGRQGWMYISENYIGFYSFLFGVKTETLIELKDIQDLVKEKSKRSIFSDSLRVKSRDNKDCIFSNLFKRDEVNDLLIQLKNQATHRLLNNGGGIIPGASSNSTTSLFSPTSSNVQQPSPPLEARQTTKPLRLDLAAEKRNTSHCIHFRLPTGEQLFDSMEITYTKKSASTIQDKTELLGWIYLSNTFLAFESRDRLPHPQQQQPYCWAVFPLYTIKRVERISMNSYSSALSIITLHQTEHIFQLHAAKTACESFCEVLQQQLQIQTRLGKIKSLKPFLTSCESEMMLSPNQREDKLIDVSDPDVGGLGLLFGYPGDAKQSRDARKVKLWRQYFLENGRNLAIVKVATFNKLVRVGLPNSLRGEIWEICCGAIYQRFDNYGTYRSILNEHTGQTSISTEEIEKDLNRSLPEYAAYQSQKGIDRLRNVLRAYAWKNPRLGYCQAMNIVTSALLIYTTEEQAFWILNVLVDRICPGYYSTSMYGAILDQMILEQLVEKTMPVLWRHFKETDVQLSVACLPWFLSLYVNSMPLLFAFRVLDCLFMDGPRILFQIGLAILKLNGEELLQITDDGAFLDTLKSFFATLNDPVGDTHTQDKKLTKFNQVMLIAYREFSSITDNTVNEMRQQNQVKVVAGIESFAKRTTIRHLRDTASFNKDEMSIIYDKYFGALYYAKESDDGNESQLNVETFRTFLASMTEWAKLKSKHGETSFDKFTNQLILGFIHRLHTYFRSVSGHAGVSFQDAVLGLGEIIHGDLMSHIDYFFKMYDDNQDGFLSAANIAAIAKDLMWLLIVTGIEKLVVWDTIQTFIRNSIEQTEIAEGRETTVADLEHILDDLNLTATSISFRQYFDQLNTFMNRQTKIVLSLPSFRMVVLTIEPVEMFFARRFSGSFKLENSTKDLQKSLGRELFENLFAEGRKLAVNTSSRNAQPHSDRSPTPSISSSSSHAPGVSSATLLNEKAGDEADVSKEVDYLFTELNHFEA